MLNSVVQFLFYSFVFFMSLACVLAGNALDKQSSFQLKTSLNLVVAGTVGTCVTFYYELWGDTALVSTIALFGGVFGWAVFGKQQLVDELNIISDKAKSVGRHVLEALW